MDLSQDPHTNKLNQVRDHRKHLQYKDFRDCFVENTVVAQETGEMLHDKYIQLSSRGVLLSNLSQLLPFDFQILCPIPEKLGIEWSREVLHLGANSVGKEKEVHVEECSKERDAHESHGAPNIHRELEKRDTHSSSLCRGIPKFASNAKKAKRTRHTVRTKEMPNVDQ